MPAKNIENVIKVYLLSNISCVILQLLQLTISIPNSLAPDDKLCSSYISKGLKQYVF